MKQLLEKISREETSHKGQNGKILIIGGSKKFTGAPALSAQAALRTGTDLVQILTHKDSRDTVAGYSEDLIVDSYGKNFDENSLEKARELEEWADVTVIGPGLTDAEPGTVQEFMENSGKVLIDAETVKNSLETSGNIFTPHSGEAEVIREKYGSVKNFSEETENTVVVTSQVDEIFSNGEKSENETGCPGMTVGGTGDVLTGVIASLWGQGLETSEATQLGVWLNGRAGEKIFEEKGNGLVATDLLSELPVVMRNYG